MDFQFIFLNILLVSVAQGINPFEGNFPRFRCLKGRTHTEGCNTTLLEEYKKTELPKMGKPDMNTNEAETWVLLFTRRNQKNPEYLDQCGGSVPKNSYYDCKRRTVIIIHGYLESPCEAAWPREMKDQLLCRGNYNVILIDYAWGNRVDYYDSINNAFVVAKQVAIVISNLMKDTCSTSGKIYIIGHSLGGQIAGITGHMVQVLTHKKVGRITALDVARPGFADVPLNERLDKSDAKCVDAIHTYAADCLPWGGGWLEPVGHSDFYPNGGSVQLSCLPYAIESILKGDIIRALLSLLPQVCFHQQSVQYFKVSINPCKCHFIGVECKSWEDFQSGKCRFCGSDGSNCQIMGMDWRCNSKKNGSRLFLKSSLICPYCDNSWIQHENFTEPRRTHCFDKCLPSGVSKTPASFSDGSVSLS